eukprot:8840653-Lingulodinium_polyedra.AAC.1
MGPLRRARRPGRSGAKLGRTAGLGIRWACCPPGSPRRRGRGATFHAGKVCRSRGGAGRRTRGCRQRPAAP